MNGRTVDNDRESVCEPFDEDIGRCVACGELEWYPLIRTGDGWLLCAMCFSDAYEKARRQWQRRLYYARRAGR